MKIVGRWLLGIGALLLALAAQAQGDSVILKRPTELREAPGEASRSLATLPAQTALARLSTRQGPWIEVRTAQGVTGWVHMFDLGAMTGPSTGNNTATGALRGLTSMFTGGGAPAQGQVATATIGIRGLGAEDLAKAQPNLAALTMAEAMRVDSAQAQAFGLEAALTPLTITPLPVPPPPPKGGAPAAAPVKR